MVIGLTRRLRSFAASGHAGLSASILRSRADRWRTQPPADVGASIKRDESFGRRARARWSSLGSRGAPGTRPLDEPPRPLGEPDEEIRRIHTASSFPRARPQTRRTPLGISLGASRSTIRKTAAAVALSGGHHFTAISARRAHVHGNRTHDRGAPCGCPGPYACLMSGRSRARSSVQQGAT